MAATWEGDSPVPLAHSPGGRKDMTMRRRCRWVVFSVILSLLLGCGPGQPPAARSPEGKSDPEKVRAAEVSVLFVGKSHTRHHDLPNLVCEMVRFRHPDKTVYAHVVGVAFLEDVARDPRCREEITSRPWKYVVLQAQK